MAKDGVEEAAVFAYRGDRTTNATADSAAAAGGDDDDDDRRSRRMSTSIRLTITIQYSIISTVNTLDYRLR
jgi:hypothetical protein